MLRLGKATGSLTSGVGQWSLLIGQRLMLTGLGLGLEGQIWACLGRAGLDMCQTGRRPRGAYGLPLGLAYGYDSRWSARCGSMDRRLGPWWSTSTLPPCLVHGALGAPMVYRQGSWSLQFTDDEAGQWRSLPAQWCSFALLGSFCTYAGMVESQRRLLGSRRGGQRLYDDAAALTVS
jgi:hypothetical protein